MYSSKIQSEQTDMLVRALLSIKNEQEAYRFLDDICTIAEIKSISQRLQVAQLLRQKVTYQDIVKRTGASSATISRVNRALLYGAEGYHTVLDRLEQKENVQE